MSLWETYQSVKDLIAENLIDVGVEANGDEGLTTLANKILCAKDDGYRLSIESDKEVLHRNESATITGTLTHIKTPVNGGTIIISADKPISVYTSENPSLDINCNYIFEQGYISSIDLSDSTSGSSEDYLRYDASTGIIDGLNNTWDIEYHNEYNFKIDKIEDSKIYYTAEDNDYSGTFDFSEFEDPEIILFFKTTSVIKQYSYNTTTDENGEFNYTYNSLGQEDITFSIKYDSLEKNLTIFDTPTDIKLTVTGSNFSSSGSNIVFDDGSVDWGDGTVEAKNGSQRISHTFTDGLTNHTVILTGVTSLGNNCFITCSGLTSVVIPDSVTSLGMACFMRCSGLTSVVIPDTVTSIGSSCFSGCTGLTSVVIPDSVTSLGSSCFSGCTGLTSIVIPDSVTSLESSCFADCSGLTSITIPDSVTSIGNSCFMGCSGLTSIVIPDSITSLGGGCFIECSGLTSIVLNWTGNIPTYNSNWIRDTSSSLKFSIPQGTSQAYISAGYPSDKIVERDI